MLSKGQKRDIEWQLFESPVKSFQLPLLYHDPREDAFDEMELLGFPLCNPFFLLKECPGKRILVKDMKDSCDKTVIMVGYLIAIKNTSTSGGKAMNFGTFIDEEGLFIDTVHFPPSAAKYPFRGRGIYEMEGKVVEEFEFYTLEVSRMERLHYINLESIADEQEGLLSQASAS